MTVLVALMSEPCGKCGQAHPWCAGHKKRTDPLQPCMARPKAGAPTCRMHGSATATARRKASVRRAEVEAAAVVERAMSGPAPLLGVSVDVRDPRAMLLELIGWSAGHVAFYRAQVQALGGASVLVQGTRGVRRTERQGTERGERSEFVETATEVGPEVHVWLRRYDDERDRLAGLCVKAAQLGLDEARIQIEKDQGSRVAEGFAWVQRAAAAYWELEPGEVQVFRGFLLRALTCLSSGDPFPDPAVVVGEVVPAPGV